MVGEAVVRESREDQDLAAVGGRDAVVDHAWMIVVRGAAAADGGFEL